MINIIENDIDTSCGELQFALSVGEADSKFLYLDILESKIVLEPYLEDKSGN